MNLCNFSVHSPDLAKVKSRLFDYERASPRSRRQLMQSTEGSPVVSPAPPRFSGPMSSHAFEANKASYSDILKNIARMPHGGKVTSTDKVDKLSRPDSITTVPDKGNFLHMYSWFISWLYCIQENNTQKEYTCIHQIYCLISNWDIYVRLNKKLRQAREGRANCPGLGILFQVTLCAYCTLCILFFNPDACMTNRILILQIFSGKRDWMWLMKILSWLLSSFFPCFLGTYDGIMTISLTFYVFNILAWW